MLHKPANIFDSRGKVYAMKMVSDNPTGYKNIPLAASVVVLVVACLTIIGWLLNVPLFQSILPNLPKMTFNTAAMFAATSLSLWSYSGVSAENNRRRRLALALAIVAALVALLTLIQYVFGWSFGIDQLLFEDQVGALETAIPGRPSPHTAVTFLLVGFALLALYDDTEYRNWLAQYLILTAAFIPLLALVGYAFAIPALFSISAYTGMALHTALSFLVLCVGLLFLRPYHGFVVLISGPRLGSVMSRRLLIAAVTIPLIAGLISILGQKAGLYSSAFAPVLLAVLSAYAFSGTIWRYARMLNQISAEREQVHEEFRLVVEASPNALLLVDALGHITLANKSAESLFGYARQELVGMPIEMLVPERFRSKHPGYRNAFLAHPQARPMGANRDLFGLRKDGSLTPVEIGLNPLTTVEGEFVLASIIDITERKQTEAMIVESLQREQKARVEVTKLNETLEERVRERTVQLEAANKELEAFSYSVSHDLRAPLRSIDGFSQAILEDYHEKLDDQARHYLQRMRTGSQRMAQLIDDLLMLSRLSRADMRRETVNLSAIAQSIADNLRQTDLERQVTIVIESDMIGLADPQLILAALENLIENAWKFTSKKSVAVIEVGVTRRPDSPPVYFVRDNGAGFDMTYIDKLFDAFQRLHSPNEFPGTGIGLATVQRIINRHGGEVWAEGAVDEGAAFYFTLDERLTKE